LEPPPPWPTILVAMVADIRPIRPAPSDPLTALRGDEIAILREMIADAQAQILGLAERVVDAEAKVKHYRGLYEAILEQYGLMKEQRDQARADADAMVDARTAP
jgi:uncharacterized coiled-coil DUF342 family protein